MNCQEQYNGSAEPTMLLKETVQSWLDSFHTRYENDLLNKYITQGISTYGLYTK